MKLIAIKRSKVVHVVKSVRSYRTLCGVGFASHIGLECKANGEPFEKVTCERCKNILCTAEEIEKGENLQENAYCLNSVIGCYERYFQQVLGVTPGIRKAKRTKKGHYPFIPSGRSSDMSSLLRKIRDHIIEKRGERHRGTISFIDCGCGIGNIVLLAAASSGYERTAGIEYDAATYKIAQGLLGGRAIKGDITKFKHYDRYDVLYYYTPIHDTKKQRLFLRKLADDMKVGAVVICNGESYFMRTDKRFKEVENTGWNCFEKIGTEQQSKEVQNGKKTI